MAGCVFSLFGGRASAFLPRLGIAAVALLLPAALYSLESDGKGEDVDVLISWLLQDERDLSGIPFARVVRAVAGVEVIAVDPGNVPDRATIAALSAAMDQILREASDPEHDMHTIPRINEVSGAFEDRMQIALDALPEFSCSFPRTAEGRIQRAGYPDLRLEHLASGRVYYIDPKLYREGSEQSGFRTFYFEPRTRTNKITEDASHILVGISHRGRSEGSWVFNGWNLVDLHDFQVRLKAEFQASNRDIYRAEAVLAESSEERED